jgi:hypothetical protein
MKIRKIFHFLRDTGTHLNTLVQQAGKMNIKKSGVYTRIGRIRRLVVRRLVAFGDWSHFRKFGDWSFGEWSFGDWLVYLQNIKKLILANRIELIIYNDLVPVSFDECLLSQLVNFQCLVNVYVFKCFV